MISTILVISGSPAITRNDDMEFELKYFLGGGGSLDPPKSQKRDLGGRVF